MRDRVSQNERATIYGIAFRRYLATGSSDYAYRGAADEGCKFELPSLRVDEIARDAVEDARKLQRDYSRAILLEADDRVAEYCEKFQDRENQIQNFSIKPTEPLSEIPQDESKREVVRDASDNLDAVILLAARLKREMKTSVLNAAEDYSAVATEIERALKAFESAFANYKTAKLNNQ